MEHNELVVQSSKGCHDPTGVLWGLSEERRPKHPAVVGTSRIAQGLDPDTLLQGKDHFVNLSPSKWRGWYRCYKAIFKRSINSASFIVLYQVP